MTLKRDLLKIGDGWETFSLLTRIDSCLAVNARILLRFFLPRNCNVWMKVGENEFF